LSKEVGVLLVDDKQQDSHVKEIEDKLAKLKKEKKALEMKVKALEEINRELNERLTSEEAMYEKDIEDAPIEDHGVEVPEDDVEETPEIEDIGEPLEDVEGTEEEELEEVPPESEEPEEQVPSEPEEATPPPAEVAPPDAQIDELFGEIKKKDVTPQGGKSKALPEQSTTESTVGSLHDDVEEASVQKHVECPNCQADILVELIPGRPTIFTCQECGQKSYTEQ